MELVEKYKKHFTSFTAAIGNILCSGDYLESILSFYDMVSLTDALPENAVKFWPYVRDVHPSDLLTDEMTFSVTGKSCIHLPFYNYNVMAFFTLSYFNGTVSRLLLSETEKEVS